MFRDSEPEGREDQVASADGGSPSTIITPLPAVETVASKGFVPVHASFQAVRPRTGLPRRAAAKVGREMPARRASSDRLQPRSAQATLTASASRTTNPDRPTVTAAGPRGWSLNFQKFVETVLEFIDRSVVNQCCGDRASVPHPGKARRAWQFRGI